jgi:RNase H-like domain found in reverse transcriptase
VQTDASRTALGAVLCQIGGNGKEHAIEYASRKLLMCEQKRSPVELELLYLVWTLKWVLGTFNL